MRFCPLKVRVRNVMLSQDFGVNKDEDRETFGVLEMGSSIETQMFSRLVSQGKGVRK